MTQISLQGANKLHRSVALEPSNIVNMVPVLNPGGKRTEKAYFLRPGSLELGSGSGSVCRGGISNKTSTEAYIVVDTTLYTVTSAGVRTSRGSVASMSGTDKVIMTQVDDGIFMTDGGAAYWYVPSTAILTEVVDAQYTGASTITSMDNYIIVSTPSSRQWSISNAGLGSAWEALDFASIETEANEEIVAVAANDRNLYIFGNTSTEVWYNSGDTFPFDRREFFPHGCAAKYSPARMEEYLYLLVKTEYGRPFVGRIKGYEMEDISGPINSEIGQYDVINDAFSLVLSSEGETYYILSFPTENKTWVYCHMAKEWVQWKNTADNYYSASCSFTLGNKSIIGDRLSHRLYEVSFDHLNDNAVAFNWHIYTPAVYSDNMRVNNVRLQADIEAGIGTGSGDNPSVTLNVSRDGGYTYGSSLTRTAGESTSYTNRVQWWRLGQSRIFNYHLSGTSGRRWRFLSLSGDFQVGGR